MPVNLIRDADIKAISIVGKGANRKRFFLFKADAEDSVELGHGRLLKAEDWSAVYCVVAEPGWHEDSGIGGPDIDDRWADEDEIRKAAHRFMANGGLVNKLHESLEPYGQLVENAVALADFTVNGETIAKGSWYIAIQPTDDGKAAIEKGEFTGVSIEGMARREQVDKGSTRPERTVGGVKDSPLLRKVAEAVGLSKEDVEAINKADRTFGELIAYREFDEILPEALDAFRDAVWYAFFPTDPDSADPIKLITESCDEFKAWALDKLENVPVEKSARAEALGVTLEGSTRDNPTVNSEDDMGLTADENKRIEKLETDTAEVKDGISQLTDSVAEIAKAVKSEPEAPTVESVQKELGEVSKLVKGLGEKVEKLGEGGSSQPVTKEDEADEVSADEVKKAFEAEGLDPNLAGIV